MSGYIIVFSFLFLAANASVIKPGTHDQWNEIPTQFKDFTLDIFEPEISCALIIKHNGYVVDDVATAYGWDAVYLKCDARCKGPGATPALEWYKEPSLKPIPSTRRRVTSYSRSSSRVQRLVITRFLKKDVGFYTCRGWLGPTIGWTEKTIRLQMGCPHPMISCDVSRCLPSKYRCDGSRQCDDGFDEYGCGADGCNDSEFFCDDMCVNEEIRCNGKFDCYDGTDEIDCPEEGTTTQETDTSYDYEDENTTETTTTATASTTTTTEATSTTTEPTTTFPDCEGDLFLCQDGECIPSTWVCDGVDDCTTGEDEWEYCTDNTPTELSSTATSPTTSTTPTTTTIQTSDCEGDEFSCWNGSCIHSSWVCDGIPDCTQGEDELDCGLATTTPTDETTTSSTFPPTTSTLPPTTTTLPPTTTTLPPTTSTLPPTTTTLPPTATTLPPTTSTLRPTTTTLPPTTSTLSPTTRSSKCAGQFDCGAGVCISLKQVCDSFPDCRDERDEKECKNGVTCQESQRLCNDGKTCVSPHLWCDGKSDCPDSDDELNCV